MHDNVVFFDTAACLDYGFIGDVNKASGGWSPTPLNPMSESAIDSNTASIPSRLIDPEFWSSETSHSVNSIDTWYHTKKILAMTDDFDWYDSEMYRNLMKDIVDLVDDCDLDCQARGSQLTLVAVLLGAVYGLVCLNALFMFIGTWRYRFRICSVYFTAFVCLFQFCVVIATGVILDS